MATTSHAHAAVQSHVPTTGHNSPDPIALHMQALNSLSRCKAMLTANEPMYLFAQQWLAEAQQAVATLQALELSEPDLVATQQAVAAQQPFDFSLLGG